MADAKDSLHPMRELGRPSDDGPVYDNIAACTNGIESTSPPAEPAPPAEPTPPAEPAQSDPIYDNADWGESAEPDEAVYENLATKSCSEVPCLEEIISKLPNDCHILDAECGKGSYILPLISSGKVKRYTAISGDDATIDQVRSEVEKMNDEVKSKIEIKKVSLLEKLPFEDESFDVILHNQAVQLFAEPFPCNDKFEKVRVYLVELNRVLKAGGFLTINSCSYAQLGVDWRIKDLPSVYEASQLQPDTTELEDLLVEGHFRDISSIIDTSPPHDYFNYDSILASDPRQSCHLWSEALVPELDAFVEMIRPVLEDQPCRQMFDQRVREDLQELGSTTQTFAWK